MKYFLVILPFIVLGALFYAGSSRDPAFYTPPEDEIIQGYTIPESCKGWTAAERQWLPAERMYEKINGYASFYIQYGVEGLISASWTRDSSEWDMTLFVMSNANSSIAVFAHERPQSAENVACAEDAYIAPGTLIARDGPYYAKFMALSPNANAQEIIPLTDSLLSQLSGAEASDITEETLSLPEEGQLPGSQNISIRDAFGFTSLKEVTHAQYAAGGTTATWYYTITEETTFHNYTNELHEYGAENFFSVGTAHGAEMFGAWEILEHTGVGIHGVRDASTREAAEMHWQTYTGKDE